MHSTPPKLQLAADFGGPLLAGRDVRCADAGDIVRGVESFQDYVRLATAVIRAILERGAIPVVLGGDHATTIPVLKAGRRPLYVVQIDSHLDWRDEREGLKDGLSSPMRRASEMPWGAGMAVPTQNSESQRNPGVSSAFRVLSRDTCRFSHCSNNSISSLRLSTCEQPHVTENGNG